MEHRAALRILRREDQPRNARETHRPRAHRARLQRDEQARAAQTFVTQRGGARAQHQHLGMRGRIVALDDAVAVAREHASVGADEHRAHRHLAPRTGALRFGERQCYGFRVIHLFRPIALPKDTTQAGERLTKIIARAGICSRRDAEKLIAEGRVSLDGKTITEQGTRATEHQVISVDGKPLGEPDPTRLWRYHKPSGLVTTHRDPEGRMTVFNNIPKHMGRVVSVGRLDYNSEGLLLLTNDGALARRLEMPAAGWTRKYRVRLFGKVTQADLEKLAMGRTIDGVKYGPVIADLERSKGMYSWAQVSLTEGKNREVKRLMESLGLRVARLIRIQFGPFHLGQLAEGAVEEIAPKVWRAQLEAGKLVE